MSKAIAIRLDQPSGDSNNWNTFSVEFTKDTPENLAGFIGFRVMLLPDGVEPEDQDIFDAIKGCTDTITANEMILFQAKLLVKINEKEMECAKHLRDALTSNEVD